MANIPEQYTQEAQDKRDRLKKLEGQSPKSRTGWSFADIPDDRWPFKPKDKKKA